MSNMLSRLMGKKDAEISAIVSNIDATTAPRGLRRKFEKIRSKKQGGFTLLELLVVVAILAAIAGTATIMLHDTDKKAFAAAHVGMMDELSKGILTFQQLNRGNYPDNWDSLVAEDDLTAAVTPIAIMSPDLAGQLSPQALTTPQVQALLDVGIQNLRVINPAATPPDTTGTPCAAGNLVATINDKTNAVTAQNIYRVASANGCGATTSASLIDNTDPDNPVPAVTNLLTWNGGNERVNAATGDRLVALGVGPDSTLFQSTNYGGLTSTPIYRHVDPDQYNRFIVLFNVTSDPTKPTNGKAVMQAIIDGAGDTKDEELGEFDNVRPT
jgi:prepilin-type N-terminal cleavage/methylation domain-containing protein